MFHLAAYYTNDLADASVYTALGTVNDPMLVAANSGFQMPTRMSLFGAYVGSVGATAARFDSPSLRSLFLPDHEPVSVTSLPSSGWALDVMPGDGFDLQQSEVLQVQVSRTSGAAADAYALAWLTPGRFRPPAGPYYTLRATAAATLVEGAWVNGALTLPQNLPAGRYQVVGMSAVGANLLAARLVFQSGGLRPGVLANQASGEWTIDPLAQGQVTVFGEFSNLQIPSVDFLGAGAGSAQTVYLRLVKVG